jgi:hypothetical protein
MRGIKTPMDDCLANSGFGDAARAKDKGGVTSAGWSLNTLAAASNRHLGRTCGDRFLFYLTPKWAIGFDDRQWILLKARHAGGRGWPWRPVCFIALERRGLERVIREKLVPVTPQGQACLNALPDTFKEFLGRRDLWLKRFHWQAVEPPKPGDAVGYDDQGSHDAPNVAPAKPK